MQNLKGLIARHVEEQFRFEHELEVEWLDVLEFGRRHDVKGVYGALDRIIKLHRKNRNAYKKRSGKEA